MIKFSVIVPLYNCEKYIAECIDSILNQKYIHFELLIINDGSTDNSREIVKTYTDERIRLIDKDNGGLLHARLTGLKEARNDYIVFVDADDRIDCELLGSLEPFFTDGADCIIYKLREFSENNFSNEPEGLFIDKKIFREEERLLLLERLLTTGTINSMVCKAFKKELIDYNEMVNYPRIAIGEDGLFTLRLFQNYSKLVYLNHVYYEYRQSNESMTHKLRFSNYADNIFRFDLYYDIARQYFDADKDDILDKIDKLFFKMLISLLINPRSTIGSKLEYREIVEEICKTEFFQRKIKESYSSQNIFYKVILRSIQKKRIPKLLFFRFVWRIIFNITQRRCKC